MNDKVLNRIDEMTDVEIIEAIEDVSEWNSLAQLAADDYCEFSTRDTAIAKAHYERLGLAIAMRVAEYAEKLVESENE